MKRSLLPIIFVLAALLIPTSAQAATTGSLSVTVSGAPKKAKKAKRTITVRAINLATGTLALSSTSTKANPTIKLAPGAYVVAVRTIDIPGTASEGTSGIAVVKAGKKTKKKLRVRPLKRSKKKAKKSVSTSAKKKSIWAPESEYAGLRVIGVDPRLTLKGLDEYPNGLEIDSIVMVPLSQGCTNDEPKVRLVEIKRRAEIIEEIERADDPRFDKSTAVERGHLMKEQELVKGSAAIGEDGKISVFLRLVDVKTGEVKASGATIGDGKTVDGIMDAIDAAAEMLRDQLCGAKVDVTFTGSASYTRDENDADMDSEDHVRATYNWSTIYKNVNLSANGSLTFATSSTVTGQWHTDGRYGAVGPGNYHCEAPVVGYNGEFSMLTVSQASLTKLTIAPFMSVMGDHTQTSCTGLSSPPYASFVMMGHHPPNQAVVEFGIADLSAGPLSFNVGPQSSLAPDCSDLPSSPDGVCSHSQQWSGNVTVTRAQ